MTESKTEELLFKLMERHEGHGSEEEEEEVDDNALITAKATAMVVLFLATLLFGLLPFQLSKWFKWFETDPQQTSGRVGGTRTSIVISLLLCFGGGVLLATTFLHLLPEMTESITALQEAGKLPHFEFHFAEMLMCIGFFTMYFVEELVHLCMHHREHSASSRKSSDAEGETAFRRGKYVRQSVLMRNKIAAAAADAEQNATQTAPHSADSTGVAAVDLRNGSLSTADLIPNDMENMKNGYENSKSAESMRQHIHKNMNAGHAHLHGHTHMPSLNEDDLIVSSLRGLLVVLALSVHELFEGLAVGLEAAPSKVWYMLGAVSAHKLVLAFCVGVELMVTRTKKCLAITYILTFAAVSPIGIGIGILVSGDGSDGYANVPAAILQGLASGTLLYVVFFEILSKDRSGLARYTAVLIGFCLMFGLTFLSKFYWGFRVVLVTVASWFNLIVAIWVPVLIGSECHGKGLYWFIALSTVNKVIKPVLSNAVQ